MQKIFQDRLLFPIVFQNDYSVVDFTLASGLGKITTSELNKQNYL